MNAPSEHIKDMLHDQEGLGLEFKDNLFIGREPSGPNDCVTIFDTPGPGPQISLDGKRYEYCSVQVRVRNTTYPGAANMSEQIEKHLNSQVNVTKGGFIYTLIRTSTSPAHLLWDENERAVFVTNFNIQRKGGITEE